MKMDNMNIFIAKQQSNTYEKCGVCKYHRRQECQRHAPAIKDTNYLAYPHVKEDDWCGDFEHQLNIEELRKELEECKDQYFDLIMSVTLAGTASRHDTALRYIREAEEKKLRVEVITT